jgi:hypothetical protein
VEKTIADDVERAVIWGLLENLLEPDYYADLRDVLAKFENSFTGVVIYGRRLREIFVPDSDLTDADKLVFGRYGVKVNGENIVVEDEKNNESDQEYLPENFDENSFKQSILDKYANIGGYPIVNKDQIIIQFPLNEGEKKVKVIIIDDFSGYEVWFDYDEKTSVADVRAEELVKNGDYYFRLITKDN